MLNDNRHIYLAVDSNILRALTVLYFQDQNRNAKLDKIDWRLIKNYGGALNEFLRKINEDEFRMLIVSTAFEEVQHLPDIVEFILDKGYFPKRDITNFVSKSADAEELATRYCKEFYVDDFGKKIPPPMVLHYDPFLKSQKPSKDAVIMAEASIEGACILTNDQDFVSVKNDRVQHGNCYRANGIILLNQKYLKDYRDFTPRPFDLDYFVKNYLFSPTSYWPFLHLKDRTKTCGRETAIAERYF